MTTSLASSSTLLVLPSITEVITEDVSITTDTTLLPPPSHSISSSNHNNKGSWYQNIISSSIIRSIQEFIICHEFVLWIICVILFAKIYPPLGTYTVHPKITANSIAVIIIFIVSGLGLPISDMSYAISNVRFNVIIQCMNFFVVSYCTTVICQLLYTQLHILSNMYICHGMIICGCLPMAINAVIVITKSSNGDVASAIFNATLSNIIGIVISPFLIVYYLHTGTVSTTTTISSSSTTTTMNPIHMVIELSIRIVIPLIIGQVLQHISYIQRTIVQPYHIYFKKIQQFCLIFIVYTVFCQTFISSYEQNHHHDHGNGHHITTIPNDDTMSDSNNIGVTTTTVAMTSKSLITTYDIISMIIIQFVLLIITMIISWYIMLCTYPDQPKLRVMGVIGCSFKTIVVGVPLIHAIYEQQQQQSSSVTSSHSDDIQWNHQIIAIYTLPLLTMHPMQLIVGSLLSPYFSKFVDREILRIQQQKENEAKENDYHHTMNNHTSTTTTITGGNNTSNDTTNHDDDENSMIPTEITCLLLPTTKTNYTSVTTTTTTCNV